MLIKLKNHLYKILYRKVTDRPIPNTLKKKFNFINESPTYYFRKFGNKNKNKLFYVIKVYEKIKEGGGLFSNVLFVLRHLQIVDQLNAIPVIDFENFYNRYNEKNKIEGTKNSWMYYFNKVSKYDLNEIYQSQNVLVTNGFFSKNMKKNFYNDKDLKNIFKKYIKIKKKFLVNSNKFVKNNFKGYKVLGVHFRGTDRITGSNHPMPPTLKQMFYLVDESLKRYKFDKIHLVTDDIRYFDAFKKRYKNKLTYRKESFRSKQSKIFHLKVRKNHRYEIGRDNIEEMLILSKLKFLICSASNLSQIAAMISKNNYKIMEINNEWNSKSLLIAQFKFYIKSFLPKYFFGFDKKPELKFIDFKDKI